MKNVTLNYYKSNNVNFLKLLIVLGFCLFLSKTGYAYSSSEEALFTVNDIAVDVTSSTAALAREKAMIQVREQALNKIFKRIVIPQDLERIPEISAKQIFEMVKEVTVLEEKTSAVRYIARLAVTFEIDAIKNILSEASIPFILETSKPILLLPVYSFAGGRSILWEESNPWLKEWNNNCPQNVVVPLMLPYGELSDISNLSVYQAENLDEEALTKIAKNYNVEAVYVINAVFYDGLESRLEINVSGYNLKLKKTVYFETPLTVFRNPDETLQDILKKGITTIANEFENRWKEEKSVFFSIDSSMILIAKTESLQELNKIINILENIPLVQNLTVQATTKEKAQFKLSFAGNLSSIISNISNKGYEAEFNRGFWVLKKQDTD